MKGSAEANGAITIVNAIAGGRGATIATDLKTSARVELGHSQGPWIVSVNGKEVKSKLSTNVIKRTIRGLGRDPLEYSGEVETETEAPIGVGLKTSSSSSVAVCLAIHSAFGVTRPNPTKVLDCSTRSSVESGVSITGALDDAASSLFGGVNLSDNLAGRVVSSRGLGAKKKVLIRVKGRSRRHKVNPSTVRRFRGTARRIFEVAGSGRIWSSMTLNGLLYSAIYGYDESPAIEAIESGGLGAGLSGTGPAVAAVFDEEPSGLPASWLGEHQQVIRTETTDGGAIIG